MVSILPPNISPFQAIGKAMSNLGRNTPELLENRYQRQLGLSALDQAQQEIEQARGDPYKIALAFAKAGTSNPNLQRSLGPLMQTAMSNAMVKNAFPNQGNVTGQQQQNSSAASMAAQNAMAMGQGQQPQQVSPGQAQTQPQILKSEPSTFATPSPFNIMTNDDMDAEAKRYANALRDPNAYQSRYDQLIRQNDIATKQRETLEDFALKSDVSAKDLPLFMKVGAKFDPRNPSEWALKTRREFDKVKSNFDKLATAFIPGLGSGLLGRDREDELKRMTPSVQDLVKEGLEQETRSFLTDNYLTPTEVSTQIRPLNQKDEKSIKSLPKGIFPRERYTQTNEFLEEKPFISYEEALEKAPKEMQTMQNVLSDYFLKNVIPNKTSLLGLRDKIIKEKDYDWRQFGPAIRQAMENGLQLDENQSQEMTEIETQPPYDSLPYIFRSLDRILPYLRGGK